jgi:hypothetical protein
MVNPLDNDVQALINLYTETAKHKEQLEESEAWMKNNLEYDLRSSEYIAEKCKVDSYAQNLYAALCNNDFIRNEMWPILKEETWGCSWRYAGGIVADIKQCGDYLDWYCSGITDMSDVDDEQFSQYSKEEQEEYVQYKQYVAESVVTEEIRNDLLILGWLVK